MKIVVLPKFFPLLLILCPICTIGFETAVSADEKKETNQLRSCICGIDQAEKTLKVERWSDNGIEQFSYNDETKITTANNKVTIAELKLNSKVEWSWAMA